MQDRAGRLAGVNLRLLSLIWSLAATVLMGVFLVGVLVAGLVTGPAIAAAIFAGGVLGLPVAWAVTRRL